MTLRLPIEAALAVVFISGAVASAQMPITKVVVAEARMMEAPATITLVGTVDPLRRSKIGSEIAGLVAQMPVRQGDFVPEGGELCRLNDDTLRLQLEEAKARLDSLRARHEELLAGSRPEELRRLKALLDDSIADHERWQLEMQRIEKLYERSDSNVKEFYDTRAEFRQAEQRMMAAQALYDLGVEGPRKEVLTQALHEGAAQAAVVSRIESDLQKTVIKAPFAGYVVERTVEIGEWIPQGGQVVEIIDVSTVLVRVDSPESAFAYLTVGEPSRVRIDALQRSFDGEIKHVIRQADPTARTFPVEIEIDNQEGLLGAGMFARATVPAGPKEQVVAVPKDAIVERNGIEQVAAAMPGPQGGMVGMLISVTTGIDVGDWIAIRSGNVQPGTSVITRGTEHILPFPTPIQIVDEKGTPVAMPEPPAGGRTPTKRGGDTEREESPQGSGGGAPVKPAEGA